MRTSTPASTISYNTDSFCIDTLNDLIAEGVIEFWAFINHLPEEDEKKVHKHLYIIPNGLVDTAIIQQRMQEYDLTHPDLLPLGCIMFVHSKFADWYLYAVHDKDYLASKNEERKYHYTKDDIYVSDMDYFSQLIHTSDFSKWKTFAKFRDSVLSGVSFNELFQNGFVPVQQIIQWKKAFNLMRYGNMDIDEHTRRGGRVGHEDIANGGGTGAPFGARTPSPVDMPNPGDLMSKGVEPVFDGDGELIDYTFPVYADALPFTDDDN